ncbi:MAG: hypothetical protein J5517_02890 [Eubacterium sp.]|nr:hypothetical protein [Eubacterium sp.]
MGKNEQEKNKSDGLVVYGAGVEPNQNEDMPQQNGDMPQQNEDIDNPDVVDIDTYFNNFRYYEKNIRTHEDMTHYTNLVWRALNRGGDTPEVVELKKALKDFTSRVTKEGYDVARAVNTAINKNYDRNAGVGAGANADKISGIRNEFHNLTDRLETFMRSNPDNPAVANIIKRTNHIIGNGEPGTGREKQNDPQEDSFSAAPGPNKKERKEFFASYTGYLRNIVNVSQAKYVVNDDDNSTPEKKLSQDLKRIINLSTGYQNDFKGFPIPENNEELKSLNTSEGLQKYLKKIDKYFIENNEKIDEYKLKDLTRFVENDEKSFQDMYIQEEYLKEISKVIKDKNIEWDIKKIYLRNACGAGLRENLPRQFNVEPYLDDYEKDGKTLKSNEDKIKSVNKWLKRVGNYIARENKYERQRNNAKMITHAMYSTGKDTLNSLPTINNVLEAGKPILESKVTVTAHMGNIYRILEEIRDAKNKRLEDAAERKNPEGLLMKLEKAGDTFFASMEEAYPGMYWSEEQIESIGAVIDVMSAVKPDCKAKLCTRMNLRINSKGNYEIGGDVPLIQKSSSQMEEAKKAILDADPKLMKSSPEYKDLRSITEKLQKRTSQLMDSREKKGKLTEEEITELLTLAEDAGSAADVYTKYKIDALGNKAPNKIEKKRINAAALVSAVADDIQRYVREYTLEKALQEGPDAAFNAIEKQICRRENPTIQDLGAMAYIRLARHQNYTDPGKYPAKNLLDHKEMRDKVASILKDKNFKKVVKEMPKELTGKDAMDYVYSNMLKKVSDKQKEIPPKGKNVKQNERGIVLY